ncbi:MAG: hypothetical protein GWN93_06045 [Deltaproteobacteria bacterium]|nr:hypothetical protein [Deltaproteobacteria bacterium]
MFIYRGVQVIESVHCTKNVWVPRTWRERLFTLPWRPLRKMKYMTVPDPELYATPIGFMGHPVTVARLMESLAGEEPPTNDGET